MDAENPTSRAQSHMDASTPRYLGHDELAALRISTNDAVESIEHSIRGRVEGRMWNAPKSALFLPDSRFMMATLAAADDPPFVAVKSLVLIPAILDAARR